MSALEGGIQDCIFLKIKDWCLIIYYIHHWHITIWIIKIKKHLLYLYTVYVYIYRICIYLMNLKDLKETYLQKSSKKSQNNLQILKSQKTKKNMYLCCLKKILPLFFFQLNSTVQSHGKKAQPTNQPRGTFRPHTPRGPDERWNVARSIFLVSYTDVKTQRSKKVTCHTPVYRTPGNGNPPFANYERIPGLQPVGKGLGVCSKGVLKQP